MMYTVETICITNRKDEKLKNITKGKYQEESTVQGKLVKTELD